MKAQTAGSDQATTEASANAMPISGEEANSATTVSANAAEPFTDGEIRMLDAYERAKIPDAKIVQLRELDAQIARELDHGETSKVLEWRRARREILSPREIREVLGALRVEEATASETMTSPPAEMSTASSETTPTAQQRPARGDSELAGPPSNAPPGASRHEEIVPLIPRDNPAPASKLRHIEESTTTETK